MSEHTADGIYLGMMSGTSLDGVDAVAVEWRAGAAPRVLAQHTIGFDTALREQLHALQQPGYDEIRREAHAANQLAHCYAQCCAALLEQAGLNGTQVRALGVHGQTIRHRPELEATRADRRFQRRRLLVSQLACIGCQRSHQGKISGKSSE